MGKFAPTEVASPEALNRAGGTALDAVVVSHSHYDHALDSGCVADLTGATLVVSESTAHIGRGAGLPASSILVVDPGDTMTIGNYQLVFVESEHSHPDRAAGTIDYDIMQPARMRDYRCGTTWSITLTHVPTGQSALVHSSAGYRPDMLADHPVDVAYLSVAQVSDHPEKYWMHTVSATGAHTVIATHWDDFFRPLTAPLKPLFFAADDISHTMNAPQDLADRDNVRLLMPELWDRTDPWAPTCGKQPPS